MFSAVSEAHSFGLGLRRSGVDAQARIDEPGARRVPQDSADGRASRLR